MKATSGLSEECLTYIGHALQVRFEHGWGWCVSEDYGRKSREFETVHEFNGSTVEIFPKRFYRHYGTLRAFKADVSLPPYSLDGMEVLAFSLNDGFDWNFGTHICPMWGFLFGQGEPQFPFWKSPYPWPRIFKTGIIAGFGSELKEKEPNKSRGRQRR